MIQFIASDKVLKLNATNVFLTYENNTNNFSAIFSI